MGTLAVFRCDSCAFRSAELYLGHGDRSGRSIAIACDPCGRVEAGDGVGSCPLCAGRLYDEGRCSVCGGRPQLDEAVSCSCCARPARVLLGWDLCPVCRVGHLLCDEIGRWD